MAQAAIQLKQTGAQRFIMYYDPPDGGVVGKTVTAQLLVSPNGDNSTGRTWATAYNTIQTALDAASTDGDDLTLISIAPHTTNYDIDTTGDPTWTGNYILAGSHRNFTKIKNTHASATSIMNFTGKVSLMDLTIDVGYSSVNGVTISGSGSKGCRVRRVYFEAEHATGAQTCLTIDDNEYARVEDCKFHGVITYTKGLLISDSKLSNYTWLDFHDCLAGIQFTGTSHDNIFSYILLHDCTIGLDIDSGNNQFFHECSFGVCATAVDDEVGNHAWISLHGELDVTLEPDNFTGVTVATHANPDTWTATPVEVRAAATATNPFKIVATIVEADAAEKFRVRLSHDAGSTWFDDISIEGEVNAQKREGSVAPTATDHIFNKGTQIVAASKCESGGNNVVVWIEIQEI